MARITVEDCIERINNRFVLVMLAAKRAKQIMRGSKPLVSNKEGNKAVVVTLREVADGKVWFETGAEEGSVNDQIQKDLNR